MCSIIQRATHAFLVHSKDITFKLNRTIEGVYDYCASDSCMNIVLDENSMQPPSKTEVNNVILRIHLESTKDV